LTREAAEWKLGVVEMHVLAATLRDRLVHCQVLDISGDCHYHDHYQRLAPFGCEQNIDTLWVVARVRVVWQAMASKAIWRST
jgi:hypothetical protein